MLSPSHEAALDWVHPRWMMGRRDVEESSLGIVSPGYPGQSHQFQLTRHELLALPGRRVGYVLPLPQFRAGPPPALFHPTFLQTVKQRVSTVPPKPLSRKLPLRGPHDNPRHGRHAGEASPTLWQSSHCHLSPLNPCLKDRKRANLPPSTSKCPRTLVTLRLYQVLLNHLHSRHLRLIGKSLRMILHHWPGLTLRIHPHLRTRSTALMESLTLSLAAMVSSHPLT